jgi:hypothetical protein
MASRDAKKKRGAPPEPLCRTERNYEITAKGQVITEFCATHGTTCRDMPREQWLYANDPDVGKRRIA